MDFSSTPNSIGPSPDSNSLAQTPPENNRWSGPSPAAKAITNSVLSALGRTPYVLKSQQDISIKARDGLLLDATLFEGSNEEGPVIIINSGVAIPRKVYRHFAAYLAAFGARAIITYDYRGITEPLEREKSKNTSMMDWALLDFDGVADFCLAEFPNNELRGVGHSFGVHVLGLSNSYNRFNRFLGLACGSGYLKYTDEPLKLHLWLNIIASPTAKIMGEFPKWMGMGGGLPLGVFEQWRKWINDPNYFMGDETIAEREHFAKVVQPMRFVNFSDDKWATEKSLEAIAEWYENADLETFVVDAAERAKPIGHLGFFKPNSSDLWERHAKWLIRN